MFDELARKAIDAALKNDWDTALALNHKILENNDGEIGALNRISQAYLQMGNLKEARQAAEKVIELDPLNVIAPKRIEKIDMLEKNGLSPQSVQVEAHIDRVFIEEPGKTKVVSLINVCEHTKLITLNAGDSVNMITKQHKVIITSHEESYIGRLPDDIANRMIYLTGLGINYATYIKSIKKDFVQVFIREVKPAQDIDNLVSFPRKR